MQVNIMSRKLIKPCTPTPLHLSKYKISFLDELSPPCNINVLLFYPSPPKTFITQLEDSLANILPQFYPLAGRYVESDHSIDCNDEGAEFVVAEAPDIDLTTKNDDPLYDLLSRQFYEVDGPTDPLLSIQITRLKADDLAIGISVSHRVFDASSLGTFVAAWSNYANGGGGNNNDKIAPSFDLASLFPSKGLAHGFPPLMKRDPNIVMKRVVFSKEDIDKLRSKIITGVGQPKAFVSRVRLVAAFITKAITRMDREKNGKRPPGACLRIIQLVNVRARTIPPLPKHSCGNLALISEAETKEEVVRFEDLIYILGEAIGKSVTCIGQAELALVEEAQEIILNLAVTREVGGKPTDLKLVFTDRSKFGFYEADFGSGKPVLVGFGAMPIPYATTLVENKNGDGLEAWVHVNRGDLPSFERYVHLSQMESEDF